MTILTGGDLGGTSIEWSSQGLLTDGREYMVIDSLQYAKDGDIAVFNGIV